MEQQRAPQHRRPPLADESAVTAIEYGLMAALIGLAILGAITVAGSSLAALYQYWSAAVVAAL